MKKTLIITVAILAVLSACTPQAHDETIDEPIDNRVSEILADRQIIRVDKNDFEITDEVDLNWLKNQLILSEDTQMPDEIMPL